MPILLLGPQGDRPNLAAALSAAGIGGPYACVTAGWQDREGEIDALRHDLGAEVRDLGLHARAGRVFAGDPDFAAAYRARQGYLQELQRLYRLRLAHALDAVRGLRTVGADPRALRHADAAAMTTVRLLDRQHLREVQKVHLAFAAKWPRQGRDAIGRERAEVDAVLAGTNALLLAGGHVAVLLNRLTLFGLEAVMQDRPLVAWSAGAMVLASRIVLFHDKAPQGPNDPEVLEAGLDLLGPVLPLPDAKRRLDLDDKASVATLARRLTPNAPFTFDHGAVMQIDDGRIVRAGGVARLTRRGEAAGP